MSIKDELERIRISHNGILRPTDIVSEARNPSSSLHDRFDWNDGTAAHNWRLEQARHLIRVFVEVIGTGQGNVESRLFVSLSSDKSGGGGYRIFTDILDDDALRVVLLQDALDDMRRFTQKYSKLVELDEIFKAINRVDRKKIMRTIVR